MVQVRGGNAARVAMLRGGNVLAIGGVADTSAPATSHVTLTEPYGAALTIPTGQAEEHKTYALSGGATLEDVMDHLFDFVENQQSGVLQWATDSGTSAVHDGGSYWTSGTPTFTDGSFVVIEPVDAYPGGGRWQCRIEAGDVSASASGTLDTIVSWSGGWTTAEAAFESQITSTKDEVCDPSMPFATADTLYLSCSNADSYLAADGETVNYYSYFRLLNYDASEGTGDDDAFSGMYVGGYIPADANDTKPVVLFRGDALHVNYGKRWGDSDVENGSCPGELDHSATTNAAAFRPNAAGSLQAPVTRSGTECNGPVHIVDFTDKVTLGAWGKFTCLFGDSREGGSDRVFGAAWGSHTEYIQASYFCFRFNP